MGLKDDRSGAGLTVPDFEPRWCSLSPMDGAQGVSAGLKVELFAVESRRLCRGGWFGEDVVQRLTNRLTSRQPYGCRPL